MNDTITLRDLTLLAIRAGAANLFAQRIEHRRIGRRTHSRKAGDERKAGEKTAKHY